MKKATFSLFLLFVMFSLSGQESEKYYCETCPKRMPYYEYWDLDSIHINAKGYYCKGLPCKTWRYYHKNGKMRMKIKYRKQLKIKYYRENGKLEKKGYARIDFNTKDVHFYWHGRWKYFDDRRKLYRIAIYQNGEETSLIMGPEDPIFFD